ncbi:MAG: single-stranded DNA-binding protein [Dehalococcoidia bacterium]|nr:single-stranded DNA-binding protein [Dehalococcoidia bacterium]
MAGLCKIMIIGNLGKDPEMRYTPSGKPVTTFSVAVNRRSNPPGGEPQEETEWFRVTAWNKLAETCNEFLSKGRKVFVEGRFQTHTFEGQDGQRRTSLEINASDMVILDRAKTATLEEGGSEQQEVEAEDLPF